MSVEITNRWAVVTKALGMGLEREVSEGAIQALRNRVEAVFIEYMGETGEEPERPEFKDEIFTELFGPDEVKSNGRPKLDEVEQEHTHLLREGLKPRQRKLKFSKTKPRSKKKSTKKKKSVKAKSKPAKKAKRKAIKRKPTKKKSSSKKKRRRR